MLTLNKLKKLTIKLPWEKLDAYASFFWPWPHVTGTPPWLLRPVKVSTSSELYPNTWLFFVFECLGIQFFNSPTFYKSVRLPMVTYPSLSSTCVTYGTLCRTIGHQVLPTPFAPAPYLGKRRISLGVTGILSIYLRSHT